MPKSLTNFGRPKSCSGLRKRLMEYAENKKKKNNNEYLSKFDI